MKYFINALKNHKFQYQISNEVAGRGILIKKYDIKPLMLNEIYEQIDLQLIHNCTMDDLADIFLPKIINTNKWYFILLL